MSALKSRFGIALRRISLALVLAVPAPWAALAQDDLKKGPRVGERIPHSLKAADQNNKFQDFKSLARKRGLVILFSRSLDW